MYVTDRTVLKDMSTQATTPPAIRWSPDELVGYLNEVVSDHADKRVWYCPNPGNAGDSIIAQGTYTAFRRAGLRYQPVQWDAPFDSTGKVVIYSGGGNLTKDYPNARTFIGRHHHKAKRLVLLPHTVNGHADLLAELGANVDLFCRERRSYVWVQDKAPGANIYLADDLAFHVDVPRLRADAHSAIGLVAEMTQNLAQAAAKRYLRVEAGQGNALPLQAAALQGGVAFQNLLSAGGTLYALRSDKESAGGALPRSNVDLSQVFAYGTAPERVAYRATRAMLSFINRFDRIVTNRLHVGIPAAMLGKEVDFYANSYYKNEAVYMFSLEDHYPNVAWRGRWPGIDQLDK